jgi:predicted dehydrogenase
MSTVKVGIIGAGAIARNHARGVSGHPQAEVLAIADTSAERAETVAREFDIPRRYASAARLIRDGDLDAVTVAVPNKYHSAYAVSALESGKHVCIDKPFTMNAAEAEAVIAASKKARKVFMLGMNWRFRKEAQTIRQLVKRGELGDVYHAKAYIRRRTGIPKFGTWFSRKALSGGGALLDIGVHMLDVCLYMMDNFQPVAVSGATYAKFGPRGLGEGSWGHSDPGKFVFNVDDFGTALIKMKNGATVALDASWVLHQAQATRGDVELFGTEGGASMLPPKLYRFGKKKGEYEVVEPQGVKIPYPHGDRFHNWIDAILGQDEAAVKPSQALAVQRILDAIYESSKSGKEVRL